jgi:DNA-binding PucR family transcriptional regulator
VSNGLVGEHNGDVLLVIPAIKDVPCTQAAATVMHGLATRLSEPVTTGAAGPASGVDGVRTGYQEATRCAGALLALGRVGDIADARDLGFLGVLLSDHRDPAGFLRDTLGPVLDYDEQRGSELISTLTEYFAHDRGIAQAAAALHVHPNTVVQRLERVSRLLGAEWKSAPRALEVQIALQLHRLTTPNRP